MFFKDIVSGLNLDRRADSESAERALIDMRDRYEQVIGRLEKQVSKLKEQE